MGASQISFDDALAETAQLRRHLLLGNGFSIGAFEGFSYQSLNERAKAVDPSIERLLSPGVDFEQAMREAAPDEQVHLRQTFIETIAHIHPRRDDALSVDQRKACGNFLATFFRRRTRYEGRVFTTNYDLVLYWVIVDQRSRLQSCGDGFGHNFTWHGDRDHDARVLYLHGGVHLYEQASDNKRRVSPVITKLKAGSGPAFSLLPRVRSRVNQGDFPIFVSEGDWADKAKKIQGNDYLRKAAQRFQEACDDSEASLFVYGHGLGRVDSHIIKRVSEGRVGRVYVGWYSEADRDRFELLAEWWRKQRSRTDHSVEVSLFDAKRVPVWSGG